MSSEYRCPINDFDHFIEILYLLWSYFAINEQPQLKNTHCYTVFKFIFPSGIVRFSTSTHAYNLASHQQEQFVHTFYTANKKEILRRFFPSFPRFFFFAFYYYFLHKISIHCLRIFYVDHDEKESKAS